MNKLFSGSVCLTDLIEMAKKKHSAFNKSQANGKIYVNLLLWENEITDKFGNTHSVQLNSKKEMREQEDKVYVGNFKPVEKKEPQPLNDSDVNGIGDDIDDLPF